jgi:dTDP-glucose 4,6-dehydratase
MQILLTGGCGFIGSALCRLLLRTTDWRILNLDKLTYAATLNSLEGLEQSARYELVQGDIADAALVNEIFARFQPDAVINLAAESHVDRSITGPRDFINTNVVGAFVMLDAARQYWEGLRPERADTFRFLHVSTDEVFGSLGPTGRFSETSRYEPRSPYAASKASADHLVASWGATYGLPTLITNCSNNYGPYQFPEKFIPLALLNALNGLPIPVYGDGRQVRDWLFVEDHALGIKQTLQHGRPGESYNMGGGAELANIDLVGRLCDLLDRKGRTRDARRLITFVADRPGHDQRYAIDDTKLRTELGWAPTVSFEQGLDRTVDWYVGTKDWWGPLTERYAGERLGLRIT